MEGGRGLVLISHSVQTVKDVHSCTKSKMWKEVGEGEKSEQILLEANNSNSR